jgi:uncharacterized protein YdaU (DUF1376 family)
VYNKKPLYQPWNEEEFLSDVRVRGLTCVQRWMYRTLLQAAFFHSTRPYLPNDDRILWVLAGCESLEQWRANRDSVLELFTFSHDSKLLGNKRVIEDWQRLEESREKMAELGRKSAAVKRTFSARSTSKRESNSKSERESEVKVSDSPLSLEQFADKVL